MEFLFEIIFTLLFEGSIEVIKYKKIPLWIRIICAIFAGSVFLFIIGIIGILAVFMWKEKQILVSMLFLLLDLLFIFLTIRKIMKFRAKEKKKDRKAFRQSHGYSVISESGKFEDLTK